MRGFQLVVSVVAVFLTCSSNLMAKLVITNNTGGDICLGYAQRGDSSSVDDTGTYDFFQLQGSGWQCIVNGANLEIPTTLRTTFVVARKNGNAWFPEIPGRTKGDFLYVTNDVFTYDLRENTHVRGQGSQNKGKWLGDMRTGKFQQPGSGTFQLQGNSVWADAEQAFINLGFTKQDAWTFDGIGTNTQPVTLDPA